MSESSVNIVLRGIQLVIPYLISFAQINTSMGQLWCFIYCWLYIDAMTVIPRRFVPNFVARCSRYAANDRSRSISVRKDYCSKSVNMSMWHLIVAPQPSPAPSETCSFATGARVRLVVAFDCFASARDCWVEPFSPFSSRQVFSWRKLSTSYFLMINAPFWAHLFAFKHNPPHLTR